MALIRGMACILFFAVFCCSASPHPERPASLLDHLTGTWILRGTIAGKQTTHDLQAVWVLNHEYVQLHEISREKTATGRPAYEAIIYIEWNSKAHQYTCLWLDSTSGGGLSPEGLAHAKEAGDSIPFIFGASTSDQIHTTFTYDKSANRWQWTIDNVENGRTQHFANLTLKRIR